MSLVQHMLVSLIVFFPKACCCNELKGLLTGAAKATPRNVDSTEFINW